MNVLLIGESCYDEYHYGECLRLSPEAPVPVLDWKMGSVSPGMAANVERNLLALGCSVKFITNDPADLTKTRYVDKRSGHQLLRVDRGTGVKEPLSTRDYIVKGGRLSEINFSDYDVMIFSDYEKGFISHSIALALCEDFDGPIFVDSKKTDLTCYPGAFIKINEFEEKDALAFDDESEIIVTKGKEGATWKGKKFPAPKVDVYDVTGAGDVFLATLSYLYGNGNSISTSIEKAIQMASRSVQHSGTYQIQKWDIEEVL